MGKSFKSVSPSTQMKEYIKLYLKTYDLDSTLISEVPKKWEKYGDMVLFSANSFSSSVWLVQPEQFWSGICDILHCKRLGLKSRIKKDGFRTPNVRLLVSEDPWTECVDNRIRYSWNVLTNMFCAGNAPERHRIATLDCRNKVVVDLYAGIGYFTLPYLVHAGAAMVHACEWNPDAVKSLKINLDLNKVSDRCIVYEGDNNLSCPTGVADYVNLGLIPSSEASWKTACLALKSQGGKLIVHGNVEKKTNLQFCAVCSELSKCASSITNETVAMHTGGSLVKSPGILNWKKAEWVEWSIHVLHSMLTYLETRTSCSSWHCAVENVHYVKSYGPHVDHVVVDIVVNSL